MQKKELSTLTSFLLLSTCHVSQEPSRQEKSGCLVVEATASGCRGGGAWARQPGGQHGHPAPLRGGPRLARSRRSLAALAGYHPCRRPVGTTYDCAPIRRETAPTKPKWMSCRIPRRPEVRPRTATAPRGGVWQSCLGRLPRPKLDIEGLRVPRRGAQAGGGPPVTESSSRRFGRGLENAEIAFLGDWYTFETPWPLKGSTQTRPCPSARARADRGPWGLGEGGGKQRPS